VSHRGGADPVVFSLSAGVHTIKVKQREDGAKIDKLFLTNDASAVPSGVGDAAENIGTPPPPVPVVTLNAEDTTITEGESTTLNWNATNSDTCEASVGWNGSRSTSGSQGVTPAVTTTYVLTCTGEGGGDSDSITVTVNPVVSSEEHWVEAEDANSLVNPMQIDADGGASGGQYVYVPNGNGNELSPSSVMMTYNVNITQTGDYVLWGRVITPTDSDDSFFIQIDNGQDSLWDVAQGGIWHWDRVSQRGGADPVVFSLSAGVHTIKVKQREDGTKIDKLYLTNDTNVIPSGLGN